MTLNPKKLAYYEKKYERNPLEDTLKFMSNEFKVNRPSLDNKALSRCLKTMQDNGLIYKTNEGNDPKNTQYFLTQKGRSLNKVFYELLLFALETDVDNEHYSEYELKRTPPTPTLSNFLSLNSTYIISIGRPVTLEADSLNSFAKISFCSFVNSPISKLITGMLSPIEN